MKSLFKKEYKDKEAFVAKLSKGSSEISWNYQWEALLPWPLGGSLCCTMTDYIILCPWVLPIRGWTALFLEAVYNAPRGSFSNLWYDKKAD